MRPARREMLTHCKRGHLRTPDNLREYGCKICAAACGRLWRKAHPKRVKQSRIANRVRNREHVRKYFATHPIARTIKNHIRRARLLAASGSFTASEWTALIVMYDLRCLCCLKRKQLTPDHVIPLSKGGSNAIDNIQPLCGLCNARKRTDCADYRLACINPS